MREILGPIGKGVRGGVHLECSFRLSQACLRSTSSDVDRARWNIDASSASDNGSLEGLIPMHDQMNAINGHITL